MASDNEKDDLALFLQTMEQQGVRKRKPRANTVSPEQVKPHAPARIAKSAVIERDDDSNDSGYAAVTSSTTDQTQPGEPVLFVRLGVDKNRVRQLKGNRIELDEAIDLHGMRENEAARALQRFLGECKFYGWRCVQIIHGKGRNSEQPGGVLRPLTIHWLKQQPEVIAFCSASDRDGGTGATNVLLANTENPR